MIYEQFIEVVYPKIYPIKIATNHSKLNFDCTTILTQLYLLLLELEQK